MSIRPEGDRKGELSSSSDSCNNAFQLRLTEDELELLHEKAEMAGMTASNFVRQKVFE